MESGELVSIIVPVYNTETYLPVCITSLLRQTHTAWELLLVDDGSTDGTPDVCRQWAARDGRIRVLHSSHAGPGVARNTGLGEARGDYVYFMDSDDWLEAEGLAAMLAAMHDREADIVVCGASFDYPGRTKSVRHVPADAVLSREEALERIITGRLPSYLWMMLFRRAVVQEPFADIPCFEDYATVYKWFAHARQVAVTARGWYHYVQREGSILHTFRRDRYLLSVHQQRHDYIASHHLMDEPANRANTVRNLLKLAKDFARKPIDTAERQEFVTQVRDVLAGYLPVRPAGLGLKRWLRLQLLLRSVPLFVRCV